MQGAGPYTVPLSEQVSLTRMDVPLLLNASPTNTPQWYVDIDGDGVVGTPLLTSSFA